MLGVRFRSWPAWTRRPFVSTLNLNGRKLSVIPPLRHYTTDAEENSEGQEPFEDFGDYEVILPQEPFVFGVSHIHARQVPESIVKPPYALTIDGVPDQTPRRDSGKIKLGGEAESKVRQAALLAKKVREFAGMQVKVRVESRFYAIQSCPSIL